ncbi:SWFGD domain-containing protein [Sphingosinicella sp. CPCC 101087]|uniref:SWFGD domain-containing protein n=1 Tax=Sphingosinicella sp. CPCC 101087 TaxID=2497754 RepID=UPI00101BC848|nr:SWFGD domain-containing protein [Sphingosinicella sp. CPCC 101087]
MAENRYGGRRDDWRQRGSSIFSDDHDDRPRRDRAGSGRRGEERGFFERAGDEVRSWFGDGEAERRRERDMRRDESQSAFGGRDNGWRSGAPSIRTPYGGFGTSDYTGGGDFDRDQGDYGRRDPGGRSGFTGRSHWDDTYRRWRDQQIEQLDREYAEYCRERQQQFDQDFDSWRRSRVTERGAAGSGMPSAGATPDAAAISTGGGSASADRASTGSSDSGGTTAAGESDAAPSTSGRSGRARG